MKLGTALTVLVCTTICLAQKPDEKRKPPAKRAEEAAVIPAPLRAKFKQYSDAMAERCYPTKSGVAKLPDFVVEAFDSFEKNRLEQIREKERMAKTIRRGAKDVLARLRKEKQALAAMASKDRLANRRTSFVSELTDKRPVGTIHFDTKVVQVIDKRNVIVSSLGEWLWVRNFDTTGLVDSPQAGRGGITFSEVSPDNIVTAPAGVKPWAGGQVFRVMGTKTYSAVAGSNTIRVIEPVDLEQYRQIPKSEDIQRHLSLKNVTVEQFIKAGEDFRSKGSKDAGKELAALFCEDVPTTQP